MEFSILCPNSPAGLLSAVSGSLWKGCAGGAHALQCLWFHGQLQSLKMEHRSCKAVLPKTGAAWELAPVMLRAHSKTQPLKGAHM